MKKKIVLSLCMLVCLCASVGVADLTNNVAKATDDAETIVTAQATEFSLKAGASVRFTEESVSGFRFGADISETYITGLNADSIEYCMILAPASKVTDLSALTVTTMKDYEGKALHSTLTPDFEDNSDTFTYYGAIKYDMTDWTAEEIEQAYTTNLVARPYIVVTKGTDKEVIYADITSATVRSIREVAENAIENLIEKNENAPKWTQAQFNSVLPYTVNKDVKAFHEQGGMVKIAHTSPYTLTETQLNVNTNTLKFVDGASYAGQAVYVQGTATEGENTYVTLEKYGDITADSAGKNATATRLHETYDLPATALSATSSIVLFGTNGVVSTNFTQVTQVIDTFKKLRDAFDYGSSIATWLAQGTKTGHYVLANDIKETSTSFNYSTARQIKTNSNMTAGGKNANAWHVVGFNGIFDGLGHSVTIKTGGGLFNGLLENVQIRNVAFKDILMGWSNATYNSPIGCGAAVMEQYPNDNGKRGSLSNVYVSFVAKSYSQQFSSLPTYASWLDINNAVVDFDYTGADAPASGSSPANGVYLWQYGLYSMATSGVTTGEPGNLDNVHVFVRNYDETSVKYKYKMIDQFNFSANTNLDIEKFPYQNAGANIYTQIGEYTSYADFANGVTSRDLAGNVVEITAEESLAKFTASEYWKVVTVGEGDTAYSYPTWYR